MPDIVDAFGEPDRNPRTQLVTRLAHWVLPICTVTVALRVFDLATGVFPFWLTTTLAWGQNGVFLVAVLHQGLARMCVKCMTEVPADAAAQAERKRPFLWVEHAFRKPRWLLAWFAACVLAQVVKSTLYGEGQAGRWLWIPLCLATWGVIYATWIHHRVSPWCPYCKPWDGGGDHESTPTPDPAGTKTAS